MLLLWATKVCLNIRNVKKKKQKTKKKHLECRDLYVTCNKVHVNRGGVPEKKHGAYGIMTGRKTL
jgi:hypothetical protein